MSSGSQAAQSSPPVLLQSSDGVLEITLNRPERLNACGAQMADALRAALEEAAGDRALRAVLITGAGRAFCAGADLVELGEQRAGDEPAPLEVRAALEQRYNPLLRGIRAIEKPVIAAVRGPAVGIGCSLALACDLVVASRSAYFALIFSRIGLVPDGGASLLVPLRAGAGRFLEMAILGEPVGAEQALAWGLVNRVVADEELARQARDLARRLAAGPTLAYGGVKRELGGLIDDLLEQALSREAEIQQQMAQSADAAEGILAFLSKREARFSGI